MRIRNWLVALGLATPVLAGCAMTCDRYCEQQFRRYGNNACVPHGQQFQVQSAPPNGGCPPGCVPVTGSQSYQHIQPVPQPPYNACP